MLNIVDAELIEGNYVLNQGDLSTICWNSWAERFRRVLAWCRKNESQCRPASGQQNGPMIAKNRSRLKAFGA
nr:MULTISPECIES: hypothetical protein [Pseudomonas]